MPHGRPLSFAWAFARTSAVGRRGILRKFAIELVGAREGSPRGAWSSVGARGRPRAPTWTPDKGHGGQAEPVGIQQARDDYSIVRVMQSWATVDIFKLMLITDQTVSLESPLGDLRYLISATNGPPTILHVAGLLPRYLAWVTPRSHGIPQHPVLSRGDAQVPIVITVGAHGFARAPTRQPVASRGSSHGSLQDPVGGLMRSW